MTRLSDSPIWTVSRDFYEAKGVAAWKPGGVPTRACNNAGVAGLYAALVRDFLADCGGDGPIHVVEIGAGSGAFAHLFLSAWAELEARLGPVGRPLRYVLTDVAEAMVAFWKKSTILAPHARAGRLDRARLDVFDHAPLALLDGKTVLSQEACDGPVVVIAHYLFDSLPCDVFRAAGGTLEEADAAVEVAGDQDVSNAEARVTFTFAPAAARPYGDDVLDAICAGYARRFTRATFTVPVGGVRCLDRLAELTSGPVLVLAADKGYSSEDELEAIESPGIARHLGTYTLSVNFDALAKATIARGGAAMLTSHRKSTVQLAALVVRSPATLARTRATFVTLVERASLIEAQDLIEQVLAGELTVDLAISLLQVAAADPNIAARLSFPLRKLLGGATAAQRLLLGNLYERAAPLAFPLPDGVDPALEIGAALTALERPVPALASLAQSTAISGPRPAGCYMAAMCHMMLDQPREALALFDQALALDPTFAPALQWRPKAAEAVKASSKQRPR